MGGNEISRKYEPRQRVRAGWAVELAKDAACIAVLAAILAVLVRQGLTPPSHLLARGPSEATLVTYPAFSYLHYRVHDLHEVPLWNPYLCGGTPFLGTSTAPVFSPANVALLAGDPLQAYSIAGAFLVWLAGAFMYAFLRAVQLGRHAALTGGAWYMLSALVIGHVSDPAFLAGPVFLPLVVAAFALAFQRASWAWTGTAALASGLMALSGGLHGDACLAGALVILALTFAPVGGAGLGKRLAMLVVGLGVGTAVAGAQLLPAFGILENAAYPARFAGGNQVSFASLTSLVAPGMIRNPSGINLSIGAIGLLFALLSVRLRAVYWVKYLWALVVIVIGALVLLRVPALQAVSSSIPRFHEAQQARALFLCVFAFAGLAAIRLDWTLQKETLDVERVFGLVVALFLAVTVGGLLFLRDAALRDDLGLADRIVGENWQAAILVGSAAVVAALFWMGSGAVRWLVLPLAVIELSIPAVLGLPVSDKPPAFLSAEMPETHEPQLRAKGNGEEFQPNTLLCRGVRDVNGTEAPVPEGYVSYMEYVEFGGAGGFGRGVHVTKANHPLLALAGVEYAYAGSWRYVGRDTADDGNGVRARRAYFANVAIVGVAMSDEDRLARLEEALSGSPDAVLVDHDVATGPLEEETGAIEFLEDHAEQVLLRTHAGAARLLVLADTWAPGWTATVDSREVPIHRVNLWMRGVDVPAGEHDVRFVYRPSWVERGLLASALGALGVVVLWLFALRRPVVQPIG